MWQRMLLVLACLAIPVAWGLVVHRTFEWIERKRGNGSSSGANSNNYPDFQI